MIESWRLLERSLMPAFERYVAIGDSTTEGLWDPSRSRGYRGWADRLAERLAETDPTVRYANLAVRGLHPATSDPRLWNHDRLHPNPAGQERIALAAAQALRLTGADGSWSQPLLPARPLRLSQRTMTELSWTARYFAPALLRRTLGRSSGDGLAAKRPELLPMDTGRSR
jgi:hypothetical protein